MIVITQPTATEEQIQRIVTRVREFGLEAQISRGASRVIIGVIGPEALLREKPIAAMPGVEAIVPVLKPYNLRRAIRAALPRCQLATFGWANTKMLFLFADRARLKARNGFCRSLRS